MKEMLIHSFSTRTSGITEYGAILAFVAILVALVSRSHKVHFAALFAQPFQL